MDGEPIMLPYTVFDEVRNIVDEIYGPPSFGDSEAAWSKYWEDRHTTQMALFHSAEWLFLKSKEHDQDDWYGHSFKAAATYMGYGWLIRLVGAWTLKRAVRLLVEWYMNREQDG